VKSIPSSLEVYYSTFSLAADETAKHRNRPSFSRAANSETQHFFQSFHWDSDSSSSSAEIARNSSSTSLHIKLKSKLKPNHKEPPGEVQRRHLRKDIVGRFQQTPPWKDLFARKQHTTPFPAPARFLQRPKCPQFQRTRPDRIVRLVRRFQPVNRARIWDAIYERPEAVRSHDVLSCRWRIHTKHAEAFWILPVPEGEPISDSPTQYP